MEWKTLYRVLLPAVLVLAVVYTLRIIGAVPFQWSYPLHDSLFIYFGLDKTPRGKQGAGRPSEHRAVFPPAYGELINRN